MYVTDHQIGLYFRRVQLAFRFLAHGARTQTTCQWTGLTPDQLATLRRRWMFNAEDRLRGPSPSSFDAFFATKRRRTHAALFLLICRIAGATPKARGAESARAMPGLESGERLCEAFEWFRAWAPDSDFEFEQLHLLLVGAVRNEQIGLRPCRYCQSAVLVDLANLGEDECPHCQRRRPRTARINQTAAG